MSIVLICLVVSMFFSFVFFIVGYVVGWTQCTDFFDSIHRPYMSHESDTVTED